MSQAAFNPSRRQLFKGDTGSKHLPMRPPWTVDEALFTADCSRCDDCIRHCPEQIIIKGSGGFPEINFQHGECTFCGSCADICQSPVFTSTERQPWAYKASIGDRCITAKQVVCRTCVEQCDVEAISLKPKLGGVGSPELNLDLCTGCGACVGPCPTQAISIAITTNAPSTITASTNDTDPINSSALTTNLMFKNKETDC